MLETSFQHIANPLMEPNENDEEGWHQAKGKKDKEKEKDKEKDRDREQRERSNNNNSAVTAAPTTPPSAERNKFTGIIVQIKEDDIGFIRCSDFDSDARYNCKSDNKGFRLGQIVQFALQAQFHDRRARPLVSNNPNSITLIREEIKLYGSVIKVTVKHGWIKAINNSGPYAKYNGKEFKYDKNDILDADQVKEGDLVQFVLVPREYTPHEKDEAVGVKRFVPPAKQPAPISPTVKSPNGQADFPPLSQGATGNQKSSWTGSSSSSSSTQVSGSGTAPFSLFSLPSLGTISPNPSPRHPLSPHPHSPHSPHTPHTPHSPHGAYYGGETNNTSTAPTADGPSPNKRKDSKPSPSAASDTTAHINPIIPPINLGPVTSALIVENPPYSPLSSSGSPHVMQTIIHSHENSPLPSPLPSSTSSINTSPSASGSDNSTYHRISKNLSYDANQKIGKGSNKTKVYFGKYGCLDAAVKVIPKKNKTKDIRIETELISKFNGHPNIAQFLATESDDQNYYVAMELCDMTLEKFLLSPENSKLFNQYNDGLYFPSELSLRCFKEVLSALHFIHSSGLFHNDISLNNILIKQNAWRPLPIFKIGDFGITANKDPTDTRHASFQRSDLILAAASGPVQYSDQHDIFSLGIVGHILFTKFHAFDRTGSCSPVHINHDLIDNKPYLERLNHIPVVKHLIQSMLSGENRCLDPTKTASLTRSLLHHPAFWTLRQQLSFLTEVYSILKASSHDPLVQALLDTLEDLFAYIVPERNWFIRLSKDLQLLFNRSGLTLRKHDLFGLLEAVHYTATHHMDFNIPFEATHNGNGTSSAVSVLIDLGSFVQHLLHTFPALFLGIYDYVQKSEVGRQSQFLSQYFVSNFHHDCANQFKCIAMI